MAAMFCPRHKARQQMNRVTNPPGTKIAMTLPPGSITRVKGEAEPAATTKEVDVSGTAKARCMRCSMIADCAYCPRCNNTICVPCYNKGIENRGQPPKLGPSLGETSSI